MAFVTMEKRHSLNCEKMIKLRMGQMDVSVEFETVVVVEARVELSIQNKEINETPLGTCPAFACYLWLPPL
jgi:hypothetical protein